MDLSKSLPTQILLCCVLWGVHTLLTPALVTPGIAIPWHRMAHLEVRVGVLVAGSKDL